MAETRTPNYPTWIKPDIGGDASTWGNVLNTLFDDIDSVVFANQQASVQIGTVVMFAGATAPSNWLICDGSSLATTGTYAALFGVLGYAYGGSGANFNLPNLQNVFPIGAYSANPLGTAGGSFNYTLDVAHLPPHAHPIVDVAHNHVLDQTVHGHADLGHTHVVNDPHHAHGGGIHDGGARNTGGLAPQSETLGATDAAATGISIQGATSNIQPQLANISIEASGTNLSTTQAVGSGAAMNIVPQFVALNFIVRYQ